MSDEACVFPDANVLLHYQQPDQIDWRTLCQAERVNLVVYPTLLTEVSDQKDKNPRRNVRDRAHKRETWLRERLTRLNEPLREGVFVVLDMHEAEARALAKERDLDWQHRDDRIIAHALSCARQRRRTIVVTNDFGLELKAREVFGMEAFGLDRSLSLPSEPDPEKERADKLERELRELKNRVPRLEAASSAPVAVPRCSITETEEEFIERNLDQAQESYERSQRSRSMIGYGQGPADSIRNPRIAELLNDAKRYLRSYYHWLVRVDGATPVSLSIRNAGSSPATNVRLWVHAPSSIRLFNLVSLGPVPEPPLTEPFRSHLRPALPRRLPWHHTGYIDYTAKCFDLAPDFGSGEFSFERIAHHEKVLAPDLYLRADHDAPLREAALSISILCDERSNPEQDNIPIRVVESAS